MMIKTTVKNELTQNKVSTGLFYFRMKSNWFALSMNVILLLGCQDDDHLGQLQSNLTVAETKLHLAVAKNQNNLITRIEHENQFYSLTFEEGDPLTIETWLINKIDYDSAQWLVTFHFVDDTNQSANFQGELDFSGDDVVVNPFLTSPLVALAQIETPVKGKFKVVVKGKPGAGVSIETVFSHYGENHQVQILGLYENYNNQVELVFMNRNNKARCSKVLTIQTTLIQNKPELQIDLIKNQLPEMYRGLYVISDLKLGFDQKGEIRWYYNGEGNSFFGKLSNGNFITNEQNNLNFYEVTMLGQRVKKYAVPNGLHHEIVEMPTGNFLVASHSSPGHPLEDVLVEIDRSSGNVVKSWDFNQILDPLRTTLPDIWTNDWLHINALYYDESDNSIVISGRSQSAVVKIDYSTGTVKWILGNHNFWLDPYKGFLLNPVNNQGSQINVEGTDYWPYGQHSIHKLPNGNLLLYDNGDYRGFYDDQSVPQASYTRIVEYKIKEDEKTVDLVWQFDNNKNVFTKYTGYTQQLSDTRLASYMWVSESTPKIVELDINDQIIFEATVNKGKTSYYRTLKVDIYDGLN